MNLLDILLSVLSFSLMLGAWRLVQTMEAVIRLQYAQNNLDLARSAVLRMPAFTAMQVSAQVVIHGIFLYMALSFNLMFFSMMTCAGLLLNLWVMVVQRRLARDLQIKSSVSADVDTWESSEKQAPA